MWKNILAEPTAIITAIRSLVMVGVLFGVTLTDAQVAGILLAVESVLTLVNRALVTPNSKVIMSSEKPL